MVGQGERLVAELGGPAASSSGCEAPSRNEKAEWAVQLDVGHAMTPVLLGPGEGETISDRTERNVRSCATTSRRRHLDALRAGRARPRSACPPAARGRLVRARGRATFGLGPGGEELRRAPAGGFVLVPAGVIHTFRNDGPATARFLNVHRRAWASPSLSGRAGTAASSSGTGCPPEHGGRPAGDAIVRGPGEGDPILGGAASSRRRSTTETGRSRSPSSCSRRAFRARSCIAMPGRSTPSTCSKGRSRSGSRGARSSRARACSGHAPGIVHSFANRSDGLSRALNLMAPGGFEQYLKELAASTAPGHPAVMAEIASRYDFEPA